MDRNQASELLAWAGGKNPGPWEQHSRAVARAAEAIAQACGMDAERAWVYGALHDIGRYEGFYVMRHIVTGWRLMMEKGAPDVARVCLTHSFPLPVIGAYMGVHDISEGDEAVVIGAIEQPMDDYDRLIQLCDGLAGADGVCLMEKRIVDVILRHGIVPMQMQVIEARFKILERFQARIGHSIYALFPEVVENTFR